MSFKIPKEDNESKTDDERILDTLARIRGVVLKDPAYDWHLAGMVSCPLECALVIEQFVTEREQKLSEALHLIRTIQTFKGPGYLELIDGEPKSIFALCREFLAKHEINDAPNSKHTVGCGYFPNRFDCDCTCGAWKNLGKIKGSENEKRN